MKILIVHNQYKVLGGEWSVVNADAALLRAHGHAVEVYIETNHDIDRLNVLQKLHLFFSLGWSKKSYQKLQKKIKAFNPDVVHFHNIFFLISFSAYDACKDLGVPVVQSLHNFRLLLPSGIMYDESQLISGDPVGTVKRAVQEKDFRGSQFLSWAIGRMLVNFWEKKLWKGRVQQYIVATEFGRKIFVGMGIDESLIQVKPNYLGCALSKELKPTQNYALYVGRITEDKGVNFLVDSWKKEYMPLKIAGTGPLQNELANKIDREDKQNIEFLGFLNDEDLEQVMGCAQFIVIPSLCFENFPMVVAESFAHGVPVIVPHMGSFVDLIKDGESGFLYRPGDTSDFQSKLERLMKDDHLRSYMSEQVKQEFKTKYTADASYTKLMAIYTQCIEYVEA